MSSDAPAHTWTPVPDWVMFSGISTPAFRLYCALLMRVNRKRDDGLAWPSMETLAAMTGFKNRQSLSRYLTELQDVGAVVVTVKTHRGGRQNLYRVCEEPPDGLLTPSSVAEFDALASSGLQPDSDDPFGGSKPISDDGRKPISDHGLKAHGCENQTNPNQTNATKRSPTAAAAYDSASGAREHVREHMKVLDHPVFLNPTEDNRGNVERQLIASVMAAVPAHGHTLRSDAREQLEKAFRDGRRADVPVGALRRLIDGILSEIETGEGRGMCLVDSAPF